MERKLKIIYTIPSKLIGIIEMFYKTTWKAYFAWNFFKQQLLVFLWFLVDHKVAWHQKSRNNLPTLTVLLIWRRLIKLDNQISKAKPVVCGSKRRNKVTEIDINHCWIPKYLKLAEGYSTQGTGKPEKINVWPLPWPSLLMV